MSSLHNRPGYSIEWPAHTSIQAQEAYARFFEDFYAISDNPGADEQWVEQFSPEATVIMASRTAKGEEQLRELRRSMWAAIATRRHSPQQIFVFGGDAQAAEVMLHGTVAYTFKAGGNGQLPWAGRAKLTRDADGRVRMVFYQVYLDTAAQKAASSS